jgi:hypothetical protein
MDTLLRREDLIVHDVDQETVVYDPVSGEYHLLSPLVAFVFRHADERTPVPDILRSARITFGSDLKHDDILVAAAELARVKLLQRLEKSTEEAVTRREVVHRLAAAAVLALPLITTLAAPAAAMAASHHRSPIPPVSPKPPKEKEKEREKVREKEQEKEQEKARQESGR